LQIVLEVLEVGHHRIDEATLEGFSHQRLELVHGEQRHRALPAVPDHGIIPGLQLVETRPQKTGKLGSVELAAESEKDEAVEHASAQELVRFGIPDDLVNRVRIAVENIGHDAVAGRSDGIAKDPVDTGPAQETRQRAIGRFFPPLPKQMEREEEPWLLHLAGLAFFECSHEQRRHGGPVGSRGADRLGRNALAGTKLANNVHGKRLVICSAGWRVC
jgi:hypothetical protein